VEFTVKKAGIVEVVVKGDRSIVSVTIEKDAFTPDNQEMIQDTIAMAINEALGQIKAESDAIDEKITGQKGALPF
jgi:DNA-binding protein YbaB